MSASKAEDVKHLLLVAERNGGRMAQRVTYSSRHVELCGGGGRWESAFLRGYRFGETVAVLKPWRRVGSGGRQ